MRIRRYLVAAAGVALLATAIAAPVSAGGPETVKIGARGVEFAVSMWADNCFRDVAGTVPFSAVIGKSVAATRTAPTRAGMDKLKRIVTKSEMKGSWSEIVPGPCGWEKGDPTWNTQETYWGVYSVTSAVVFGQAGSGYAYTGIGMYPPVTNFYWVHWVYEAGVWIAFGGSEFSDEADMFIVPDLGWGGATTYVDFFHDQGWLNVGPCMGYGAWYRDSMVNTGAWDIDPNGGWTYDVSSRRRACDGEVWLDGQLEDVFLSNSFIELSRSIITTVDVVPYWAIAS
jgi:hypothetical protein